MSAIPNITETELATLKATTSADEWNRACDTVKRARAGQYPPDWYALVVQSGLAAEVQASWSGTSPS